MLSVLSVFRFMKKKNDQNFLLTLYTFLFKTTGFMMLIDMFIEMREWILSTEKLSYTPLNFKEKLPDFLPDFANKFS